MPFDFQPAVRTNTAIIIALAGASGSGKTKSALELAVGLAGADGKILLIDTEGRRALHYADEYRFYHHEWRPPFTPAALGEMLREADRQKFAAVIVDSMSDEHEGEGGLCDMAEAELAKQGSNKNSAAAWARPKAQHKREIVRWLRQARCHVIFCLRADEKVRFEKAERNGKEVTVVVPIGWQPIAEKRLLYDVTTSLLFKPDAGRAGMPEAIKLYDKHAPFFPADKRVSREAGRALAAWCAGGAPRPPEPPEPPLRERALAEARRGTAALRDFWESLPRDERAELRAFVGTPDQPGEARHIAADADEREAREDLFDRRESPQ